jgi:hypothetical protein
MAKFFNYVPEADCGDGWKVGPRQQYMEKKFCRLRESGAF